MGQQAKRTKLLISIVSYNSLTYLKECLDSIKKYPPSLSFKVVVVDNASGDGTQDILRKDYRWVSLIANQKNYGFAAANNRALSSLDSEYVMLMNSDCQVFEDSLDRIIGFMEENKETGVVGPRILNSDGTLQLSCRRFPSMFYAGAHSLLTVVYPENPISRRYKMAGADRSRPFEVDWVSGSAMAVRRKALEEVGLLDERFFMYVEDLDLCYRMWKKNWKVYYFPHGEVLHHVGASSRGKSLKSSLMMQKSVLLFYLKNYRKNWRIIFIPVIVAVLALRIFFSWAKLKLARP